MNRCCRPAFRAYGHKVSRDVVRTQLAWLRAQGLVRLSDVGGCYVAEITGSGEDVANGLSGVPGVKEPRARGLSMTRKLKPLSRGERAVIWRLASLPCAGGYRTKTLLPCAYRTIRPESPGCPDAPDSPMKRFPCRSSPACARLWKLLGKDIRSVREEIYAGLKTPGTEDGGRREP